MATKKAKPKTPKQAERKTTKNTAAARVAAPKVATAAKITRTREADPDIDRDDAPPPVERGAPSDAAAKAKKPPAASRSSRATAAESESPVGIAAGDTAPSFVLKDHSGSLVSSESLRGSSYILYFYPKDDTPGCTLEACGFRDSGPRFSAKGVRVLGVSPDSPETHARFRKKYGLTFALLSDPEKTLSKAYGVWVKKQNYGREYMGVERSTFFVDRAGVVKKAWRRVRVPGHVDDVVHSV